MKKVTLNDNLKVHYAVQLGKNFYAIVCGCDQIGSRRRFPRYRVQKENVEVTCERCKAIAFEREKI